jgi:hypothetical protein
MSGVCNDSITILFPPAISETGEEWFSKQPEAMQRQMMGQAKYQAWIDGKFSFDKLSGCIMIMYLEICVLN